MDRRRLRNLQPSRHTLHALILEDKNPQEPNSWCVRSERRLLRVRIARRPARERLDGVGHSSNTHAETPLKISPVRGKGLLIS